MGWRAVVERYCGKQMALVLFLLCAMPLTLFTAMITPPGQSPDEVMHYARALGLARGVLMSDKVTDIDPLTGKVEWRTNIRVEAGLLKATIDTVSTIDGRSVETQADWHRIDRLPQTPALFPVNLPNTATYFPTAYLPSTLGVAVAKYVFGATPLHCFLTARVFMALAYVAVGLAALGVAGYGEGLLLALLLLPMPLFLAGTLNEDGLLLAMTCLACAFLTRGTRSGRIAGLATFALVLGAKPPYLLMMGAFSLPLFTQGYGRRFTDMALAMVPVLLWIVVIVLFVIVPYAKEPYHPGSLYVGDHSVVLDHADPKTQLHVLLARPKRFLALPVYATLQDSYNYMVSTIGVLGVLQIVLPESYYHLWRFALICAAFGLLAERQPVIWPPRTAAMNFLAVAAAIGVSYWMLQIIFYLDWTNVGAPFIDGVQGRYLLIFLPFFLFLVPNLQSFPGLRGRRFVLPPLLPALPAIGLALFDIGYIPLKLVLNYYLH